MDILERQKFIFGSIFLLANKLQVIGDQYLGRDDMTTKQWFLTMIISQFRDNPPTISEVSDLMGSSRQNVKQLALKLEEKGFLTLEKDEKDARITRLVLTKKSFEYWGKREEQDDRFIYELFSDFSKEETDITSRSLKKLIDRLERIIY